MFSDIVSARVGAWLRFLGGNVRRFLPVLSLLAVLGIATPGWAQSAALKDAWTKTSALMAAGRYAEAESWAKKALPLAQSEAGADKDFYATSLTNLAELYQAQARYAEAEPPLKQAEAIWEKLLGPDHPAVALSLNNLAGLYLDQGRYAEAEPLFKRALTIREKSSGPDSPEVAASLGSLALLYDDQGRFADAEPLYKRALAINEKAFGPGDPAVAQSLNNLAALYDDQRRFADAEPLYQRALAIREKALGPEHPLVGQSLNNLAKLYYDQRRYAEAEPLYQRALAIQQKTFGADHPDVAIALNNLAALYNAQGRFAESLPLLQRALAIREKALGPNHPAVANSLVNLAALYHAQGRFADELPFIRRAAAVMAARVAGIKESRGGQAELRNARAIFLEEAEVAGRLAAANTPAAPALREEAFAALQWSKASDTAAAVSHMAARFAAGSDALANLVRQRQDAQDRLDADEALILKAVSESPDKRDAKTEARLRAETDATRQRLTQLDAELAAKFPRYAELANPRPVSIAETQKLLAPDQALVVFAVAPGDSLIAVVRTGGAGIFGAPVGDAALSAAIKKLRASLDPEGNATAPPFEASTAFALYQQLFAPIEPGLQGVRMVYVVTDGALDSLPLGVLLTGKPTGDTMSDPKALREAPWFARRYAVSVLPSASSLKSLRLFARNSRASLPFLGIGDPLLDDHPKSKSRGMTVTAIYRGGSVDVAAIRGLPSLPETAGELAAEAKLFKAPPGSVMLRENATVAAVRRADLSNRRVIAFATHGLLAGDVGIAEPGLVLTPPASPSADDDGLLKASQIAQLKLNADLVILSACNTAASDGTPGAEGFSGLSKAFLYAGTRSLMVSHWSVVSDSTVALMTRLVAHLDETGVGRAEALRRAELEVMADPDHSEYAHPLFWAPFVVVGEGG